MNRDTYSEVRAAMAADLVRNALSLAEGKTVVIKGAEWDEFVAVSERLQPGSREWRCVFTNGYVSITDLASQHQPQPSQSAEAD